MISPKKSREKRMILSISIVNYNTSALTRKCVHSIVSHTAMEDYEILVVDNASTDGGLNGIEEVDERVQLICLEKNYGFAKGNNVAYSRGKGRLFLLLNPDTEVSEGALDNLVSFIDAHPECAAVGPRLVYPDGSLQYSCRTFPDYLTVILTMLFLEKLFPRSKFFGRYRMTYWEHDTLREVDQPMGACLLFRSDLYNQFERLDERFFMYFEEVDLCKRLKQSGWKIYFMPDAKVVHHENQSTKQDPVKASQYYFKSMVEYFRKHHGEWSPWVLKPLLYVGIALRVCLNLFRYATVEKDMKDDFLRRVRTFSYLLFKIHGY